MVFEVRAGWELAVVTDGLTGGLARRLARLWGATVMCLQRSVFMVLRAESWALTPGLPSGSQARAEASGEIGFLGGVKTSARTVVDKT
jgi:hypothetical protein